MAYDEQKPESEAEEQGHVHRRLSTKARRRKAIQFYKNLEKLYIFSDPNCGSIETVGKDFAARNALLNIRLFTKLMAGWAVDHAVGKAIELQELLPPYDPMTRSSTSNASTNGTSDLHRHELRGGELSDESDYVFNADSHVVRQALLNLVEANSIALPRNMAKEIVEALRALSWGEVLPILAPSGGVHKKKRFRQLNCQLKALEHIEYRVALGQTRVLATKTVSEAYGIPFNTLKTWSRRIKEGLDQAYIQARLQRAINFAGTYNGKPSEYGIESKYAVDEEFSQEVLLRDALSLKRIEKELKDSRIKRHGRDHRA